MGRMTSLQISRGVRHIHCATHNLVKKFSHGSYLWSPPTCPLTPFFHPPISVLYCTTPALDGYVSLPDRAPCTWMITSLNICGMDFYDLWNPHSHQLQFTSVHPFFFCPDCFHPSRPPADKAYPQLIPVKLGYHPWISQPWPNLWHLSLWIKCGQCGGRDRQWDPKGDKVPLRDKRSATRGKMYLRSFIQLGLM